MAVVYILYSEAYNKYYVGSCDDLASRFHQHLEKVFSKSFTSQVNDWIIYFTLVNLDYKQARDIEAHIKRMKSKKYITDLKEYSELSIKLIEKYKSNR
ncbi:MAG: GIY-YIG nuclease family protein [Bacteroidia bacterium]|nr:GIY-YIG nuclease family protein [Bacteroidia bacterium]